MDVPYGWGFATLCLVQGALVAAAWRRPRRIRSSRLIGIAVPIVVFLIGLAATRGTDWSREWLTHLATFGTPLAAAVVGWTWGWRGAWLGPPLAGAAWLVAWRVDGLTADAASVLLIAAACLTLAVAIARVTPEWAVAAGLVVLAAVDSVLVFTDQVRPGTRALHAVVPPEAGGRPLPALQDATFDRALFGWLDILAPALAATLLAGWTLRRSVAAVLTAAAALGLGLLLAVTNQVPGTIPPLVAVALWAVTTPGPAMTGRRRPAM